MSEYGQELLGKIEQSFVAGMKKDSKVKKLQRLVNKGLDYEDANEYAIRVGEIMSKSLVDNLNASTLSYGYITSELAEEILEPVLGANHELITLATNQIQSNINKKGGIGLGIMTPELDTSRIDGLVDRISNLDSIEKIQEALEEPIINYSQAIVDQSIRKNMSSHSRAGLSPKIIRKAEAPTTTTKTYTYGKRHVTVTYESPCEWCKDLEGTYDYADVKAGGEDVYRRHEGCRCIVTYVEGDKRQDVWSKTEWTGDDAEIRREAIEKKTEERAEAQRIKVIERQKRADAVQEMAVELGMSDRTASIAYNKYKSDIENAGLDYVIDSLRNSNEFYRKRA